MYEISMKFLQKSKKFSAPSMNNPVAAFLIAPSITPFYVNNPGFKKYYYDIPSAAPIDYEAHFMDLFVANRQKKPNWQLEYTFSSAYGVCLYLSLLIHSNHYRFKSFRIMQQYFVLHVV